MLGDWNVTKLIDCLKEIPKGFGKKNDNKIEVNCCEYAELKLPLTEEGYFRCTAGAGGKDDVCPCRGLYGHFDGCCRWHGKTVAKKFILPESGNYIASNNFELMDNGLNIGFKDNAYSISINFDSFGNNPFGNSINSIEDAENVSMACEKGLAHLNELEDDLKKKLQAIKRLEERLAKGMLDGYVGMTKDEIKTLRSVVEHDGELYTIVYHKLEEQSMNEEVEDDKVS